MIWVQYRNGGVGNTTNVEFYIYVEEKTEDETHWRQVVETRVSGRRRKRGFVDEIQKSSKQHLDLAFSSVCECVNGCVVIGHNS